MKHTRNVSNHLSEVHYSRPSVPSDIIYLHYVSEQNGNTTNRDKRETRSEFVIIPLETFLCHQDITLPLHSRSTHFVYITSSSTMRALLKLIPCFSCKPIRFYLLSTLQRPLGSTRPCVGRYLHSYFRRAPERLNLITFHIISGMLSTQSLYSLRRSRCIRDLCESSSLNAICVTSFTSAETK